MTIKRDIEFLFEIGSMRKILRTWEEYFSRDLASVTEHTYRVMWISLIIAKHFPNEGMNVNTEKLIKLAMIHDIGEIRSIDLNYITRYYSTRDELSAVKDTFKNTSIGEEFLNLWKEMEEKSCIEAKIIKDADVLDADMEIQEKIYEGNKLAEHFREKRLEITKNKLFTKIAKDMIDEIYNSNPHDWHINGKNIFNQ